VAVGQTINLNRRWCSFKPTFCPKFDRMSRFGGGQNVPYSL
jgi:hypothetical protein